MADMTKPWALTAPLPFQPGGNPLLGAQSGLEGLAQQYGAAYNSALAQNQSLYENILAGYNQTLANQTSAASAIQQGYTGLYNTVMDSIKGTEAAQRQALADQYAQQTGQATQSLISRGLGNTTVQDAVQRGLALDKAKADTNLSNQFAQLTAGYQSQLGLSALGQQQNALAQQLALSQNALGWMNTVQAQYPNAQDYYGLYQQQGAWQQANADRQAMQQAAQSRASVPVPQAGASAAGGYRPGGSAFSPAPAVARYDTGGSYLAAAFGGGNGAYLSQAFGGIPAGVDYAMPGVSISPMGGSLGYGGDFYNPLADLGYDSYGVDTGYDPYYQSGGYPMTEFNQADLAYYPNYGGGGGSPNDYSYLYNSGMLMGNDFVYPVNYNQSNDDWWGF